MPQARSEVQRLAFDALSDALAAKVALDLNDLPRAAHHARRAVWLATEVAEMVDGAPPRLP